MAAITISPADAGKNCPYCRFPLKAGADAERCDACGAIHHEECWRDGGGCAVLGCQNAGVSARSPSATAETQTFSQPQSQYPGAYPRSPRVTASRGFFIVTISALLIAAGGIGAFVATRGSKSSAPQVTTTIQTVQTTASSSRRQTSPTENSSTEFSVAQALSRIVVFSQRGRNAVKKGDYAAAIANREATLSKLEELAGGSVRIQKAVATFRRAINASLQSDRAYATGTDANRFDAQATRLKKLFVKQYNPIAAHYGLPTFSEWQI